MTSTKLQSIAPALVVRTIGPVRDYMVERLGFRVAGEVASPPAWASLVRDAIEIMLVCRPLFFAPPKDWAAYIYLDKAGIDPLYQEFKSRGAQLVGAPVDKPYGNREFEVRLPDGRLIAFGG